MTPNTPDQDRVFAEATRLLAQQHAQLCAKWGIRPGLDADPVATATAPPQKAES